MTFVKGQSGNPAGRPKGVPTLQPILRRVLDEIDAATQKPHKQLLVEKLLSLAIEGDLEAVKVVLDRIDGKVVTTLEHAGAGGGPLRVEVVYHDEAIGDRG